MKYLAMISILPKAKIFGLARYEDVTYEYFDREKKEWIENNNLFGEINGISSTSFNFQEITKAEAQKLARRWGGDL